MAYFLTKQQEIAVRVARHGGAGKKVVIFRVWRNWILSPAIPNTGRLIPGDHELPPNLYFPFFLLYGEARGTVSFTVGLCFPDLLNTKFSPFRMRGDTGSTSITSLKAVTRPSAPTCEVQCSHGLKHWCGHEEPASTTWVGTGTSGMVKQHRSPGPWTITWHRAVPVSLPTCSLFL